MGYKLKSLSNLIKKYILRDSDMIHFQWPETLLIAHPLHLLSFVPLLSLQTSSLPLVVNAAVAGVAPW